MSIIARAQNLLQSTPIVRSDTQETLHSLRYAIAYIPRVQRNPPILLPALIILSMLDEKYKIIKSFITQ
jgi:hypothetical protein